MNAHVQNVLTFDRCVVNNNPFGFFLTRISSIVFCGILVPKKNSSIAVYVKRKGNKII